MFKVFWIAFYRNYNSYLAILACRAKIKSGEILRKEHTKSCIFKNFFENLLNWMEQRNGSHVVLTHGTQLVNNISENFPHCFSGSIHWGSRSHVFPPPWQCTVLFSRPLPPEDCRGPPGWAYSLGVGLPDRSDRPAAHSGNDSLWHRLQALLAAQNQLTQVRDKGSLEEQRTFIVLVVKV